MTTSMCAAIMKKITTTPSDMAVLNHLGRYQRALAAVRQVPRLSGEVDAARGAIAARAAVLILVSSGGPPREGEILEVRMPYRDNADLPTAVRQHLPEHAQDIYRAAFNHAFAAHAGDPRQEEAAHRIAWAAVKRSFVKVDNEWVARSELE
jgi:cation transport regulator